jgi:hypothetical protein
LPTNSDTLWFPIVFFLKYLYLSSL